MGMGAVCICRGDTQARGIDEGDICCCVEPAGGAAACGGWARCGDTARAEASCARCGDTARWEMTDASALCGDSVRCGERATRVDAEGSGGEVKRGGDCVAVDCNCAALAAGEADGGCGDALALFELAAGTAGRGLRGAGPRGDAGPLWFDNSERGELEPLPAAGVEPMAPGRLMSWLTRGPRGLSLSLSCGRGETACGVRGERPGGVGSFERLGSGGLGSPVSSRGDGLVCWSRGGSLAAAAAAAPATAARCTSRMRSSSRARSKSNRACASRSACSRCARSSSSAATRWARARSSFSLALARSCASARERSCSAICARSRSSS